MRGLRHVRGDHDRCWRRQRRVRPLGAANPDHWRSRYSITGEAVGAGPAQQYLDGTAGKQVIDGRGGNDTLDGGADGDEISGGEGDDTVSAQDRAVDTVACGEGADTVTADWNDVVAADCETVNRSVRDDDADGSPSGVDCNDGSAAIKPGAGDVPGNGVDEDCSGEDAKRAVVRATFASGWSVFTRWTVMSKLQVKDAPAGAKLLVTCKGKGCPFARKSVKLKQGRANLSKRFKGKRLRPGTVIELRVTSAGTIGKVQRITIRKRKDPKRVALCLAPGAPKPTKCG